MGGSGSKSLEFGSMEKNMYVQYIKKQSQRKEMRRIKKKKETNKCSKSVNKLKVGHHKYTVKKNQSVNKDSRGCNQQKLIRAISVLNQKGKKKKSGCSVSSMKDCIDGLGLILQSKANKVVTERFLPCGESKSFNSADPLKIQSQVINEQVIEADIASSHSDDVKLDPRRVCNNDVTTHNVEDTVKLRDAENAAPNNNQSSQNRRSDDVFETKEDSACSPPSGIHTATKTSREASPSPIRLSSSCLDDECNSVRKVRVQVVPNQLLQSEEQSDVKVGQGASPMSWNTNRNNDIFFNLKFKVNGEKSPKKKIDPIFKEEDLNHMMPLKRVTWLPINELPVPEIDLTVAHLTNFEPIMEIIDLITAGTPPTPHVSMRYELLRFCTLRSYPREDKPCLVKLSEAGFYYASDGDGVVCYCCGIRRYNWTAEDNPRKIHERINPSCKFLRKNEEVNVPVQYFGPYSKELMAIMEIPEPKVRPQVSEDVNNDWAPERIRAPASQQPNRANESGTNALDKPKHSQYATKTAREASYGTWPDTSSHTPEVLLDAGFFYAGFGDCARCFYCGIGLRHWTAEDDPWIEHARWSKNCVFVKQKKGEEFVNLVQLAVQYAQDNEANPSGQNQLQSQEIERILLSDAAQCVLEMGYQPRLIKKSIEEILKQNGETKITATVLMEKVLEVEESEDCSQTAPQTTATTTSSATAAQANTETDKEVTKPEESKEATTKSKAEQKTGKFDTSKGNKSKAHVEGKVKLGDTEMEPEPDENLTMQCQKCQQDDTLVALLDDDTEKNSSLDQSTVCLEHPDTEESMEQLKNIEEDKEYPVIETIENIQSNLNELTENLNKNMYAEAKNKINLNELETSLKVSPGLKMITPQETTRLKLNNLKRFFRKQFNFSDYQHFLKYQKTVFNPVHFRPEKPVLCVCPYRYNGNVLVIPWRMMYQIYRLLSLRNANIESEYPITIRLARDGFFSDNSGIVSCVFCGSMIPNYLFLSQSHEELTTFLYSHCRQCMQRRNNIPLDNYGSHFNLADLMASSDMQLIYLVPSGSSHPAHGARYTCPMARWIHDHFQEIVHSGIRLPQAASAGLPQPDPTPAVIVQQGPIPSDRQSVTSGNIPAVSPSTVEQAVVPASRTIASAVIPKSYVSPPPQSCHMSQQQMEEISGHMAEGESQQQMEEINEEQPLNGLGIGTGAGEEIIRGELPSNSDAHVGVEDNTRVDVERQLPEPRVEGNFDFAEKTGTNRAEEDNQVINDICRDHGTGAEARAGIRVPEMSNFDERIESFTQCRRQFRQTPQAFTLAGLFYTGDRDQVRCFMCGGCLDQWEEMDNPFLEHVRHYPQCDFIWNFVIDLQMHNNPLLPHVIDAFVMSSAGSAAAADGYTHRQIYNAVDRLIVNRDIITYENIIGMLRDMGESPRH